jgi:hypothetical protein
MALAQIMIKSIANGDLGSTGHEYSKSGLIDPSSIEQELDNMAHIVVSPALIYRINHEQLNSSLSAPQVCDSIA